MLRIDRHRLGPRVYVLGARIHEWHLGAGILLLLGVGAAFDRVDPGVTTAVPALLGLWLVAKDWRDLVPSRRDTAAWRLGLHGVPAPCGHCDERTRYLSWPRSGPASPGSSTSPRR